MLRDYVSQVVPSSIQLSLNGQVVTPQVTQEATTVLTTVSYDPYGALRPGATNLVRLVFSDNASPAVVQTNDFEILVMDEAAAGRIINIDFNGLRKVPGPDVQGPTYEGQGAAGGGRVFNGIIANSILPGGGDDDNLTVGAVNLLGSLGNATTVSFTVSPVGGDVRGAPTTDPASPAALFSDYIFNNPAGNTAGQSPFTIDGLGLGASVDLYFYKGPGSVSIPGASPAPFTGSGIFTTGNTVFFRAAPVTDGKVTGSFGDGVTVIYGPGLSWSVRW